MPIKIIKREITYHYLEVPVHLLEFCVQPASSEGVVVLNSRSINCEKFERQVESLKKEIIYKLYCICNLSIKLKYLRNELHFKQPSDWYLKGHSLHGRL